ncbi:MAG: wax ester/triacylglycerol synthase family O-acyltransferase [Nevskia sp.]|nr:wax ester/triacylglycerol synthase family O-acyltransferase [Nevskia sp.]
MKQLSGLDSAFLNLETADAPMHVGCVSVLDLKRAPANFGFAAVRARIAERLYLLPILRRRLVTMPLNLIPAFWIDDPDFRLGDHVQRLTLKAPGRDRQLAELVAELISKPLDRSRPLWAFYYVEGLSRQRVACISLIHHACSDGIASAQLLGKLLDLTPHAVTPADPGIPADMDEVPLAIDRLLFTARELWRRQRALVQVVRENAALAWQLTRPFFGSGETTSMELPGEESSAGRLRPAPRTRFNATIDANRSYACRSLSLARMKAIKKALHITVNDVLLAVCAGALRAYLLEKNELPERPLTAAVPVSVRARAQRGEGGNRLTMLSADLPTHLADPLARAAAIALGTAHLKTSHRAVPAKTLMDWMELPAPALMGSAARLYESFVNRDLLHPPFNLVISNVPGPPVPLYLAGAPLLANYPISIPYHGLAFNLTVLSYCDQLDVGLTAHRGTVPDIEHLMDLLEGSLQELATAANVVEQPKRLRRQMRTAR